MIVSINQPAYLPWLGYFHRIAISDVHVVLDHVQLEKNSFTNRNKVRTEGGWCWLTVPLRTKGRFGELPICEVEIADGKFAKKHWQTLRQTYAKTPYFSHYAPALEEIYLQPWTTLAPLMRRLTAWQFEALGIHTPLLYSSDMSPEGTKSQLVLSLCRQAGATVYLSGPLGRDYLCEEQFHESGLKIEYHDYSHPNYPQMHGGFEPFMAAVDLLFHCGPESRAILMQQSLSAWERFGEGKCA